MKYNKGRLNDFTAHGYLQQLAVRARAEPGRGRSKHSGATLYTRYR